MKQKWFITKSSEVALKNNGVLTFVHTLNYGAVLQGVGLCKVLSRFTGSSELIDYSCPAVEMRETPTRASAKEICHPRRLTRHLINYKTLCERAQAFDCFERGACSFGKQVTSQNEIASLYDMVIVGSDQVWSPRITLSDELYFLGDKCCSNIKKVAYAASFGDYKDLWKNKSEVSGWLKEFDSISVREESGRQILKELGIGGAKTVLDPTLLLTGDDWSEYERSSNRSGKFVFAYAVSERDRTLANARRVARTIGAEVVFLECYPKMPAHGVTTVNSIGPDEFIWYIRNASYIVTSSFHGMCFSILFQRPFRFVTSKGAEVEHTRTYALATALGLEGLLLREETAVAPEIDYSSVNKLLERLRRESLEYLGNAVG